PVQLSTKSGNSLSSIAASATQSSPGRRSMRREGLSGWWTTMTSGGRFLSHLTLIDDLTRPDHSYLTSNDSCAFIGEYTARGGFSFSETNDLISNLKKSVDRRLLAEWRYKELAIQKVARTLKAIFSSQWLDRTTFVPIPPSKIKTHHLYDDRLVRIL